MTGLECLNVCTKENAEAHTELLSSNVRTVGMDCVLCSRDVRAVSRCERHVTRGKELHREVLLLLGVVDLFL